MARVRYMVNDPSAAAGFYTEHFGFAIELQVPAICIVSRGDLTLLLSGRLVTESRTAPYAG